jgi:hypothetical protein
MSTKANSTVLKSILFALSGVQIIYLIYKANTMCIGHDEASTYLNLTDYSLWQYLTNADLWPHANNHLLNTFLIKALLKAGLPPTILVLRIPVLCFAVLYLLMSIKLALHLAHNSIQAISLFIVLNATAYLADFFSLARGYGICLALSLVMFYYALLYIDKLKQKYIVYIGLTALFMIAANFTAIQLLLALNIFVGLFLLHKILLEKKFEYIKHIVLLALVSLAAVAPFTIILNRLSSIDEFKWGVDNLLTAYKSYRDDLIYNNTFKLQVKDVINILFAAFIIITTICLSKIKLLQTHVRLALLFPFILLLISIALFYTAGAYYPETRKALIFYPFIAISICISLQQFFIIIKRENIGTLIVALLASTVLAYYSITLSLHTNREWWYNASDKNMMNYLYTKHKQDNISLGCHWMYQPSLQYYNEVYYHNKYAKMAYNKVVDTAIVYDYYYTFLSDAAALSNIYVVEKVWQENFALLKRKTVLP